jgi:hypothetical protein
MIAVAKIISLITIFLFPLFTQGGAVIFTEHDYRNHYIAYLDALIGRLRIRASDGSVFQQCLQETTEVRQCLSEPRCHYFDSFLAGIREDDAQHSSSREDIQMFLDWPGLKSDDENPFVDDIDDAIFLAQLQYTNGHILHVPSLIHLRQQKLRQILEPDTPLFTIDEYTTILESLQTQMTQKIQSIRDQFRDGESIDDEMIQEMESLLTTPSMRLSPADLQALDMGFFQNEDRLVEFLTTMHIRSQVPDFMIDDDIDIDRASRLYLRLRYLGREDQINILVTENARTLFSEAATSNRHLLDDIDQMEEEEDNANRGPIPDDVEVALPASCREYNHHLHGITSSHDTQSSGSEDVCAICLDRPNAEDSMVITSCKCAGHRFHRACFDRLLRYRIASCPMCRQPF